ncbi:MAG: alkaline shock response membrane anchor protein AmaP [Actinomycetota bacterium]|nr:alkaline shock response membrane anchor protein AmaP [Actinomycetota bacterium]
MIRQRINLRTSVLAYFVRALVALLALSLIWYGLMVVLLAVKVSPHTVNSLSAYRTLYDDAISLHQHDFTTVRRLVAGAAGLLAFLLLLTLALQEIPRPYLTRSTVLLEADRQGATTVSARAIERLAEIAAQDGPGVTAASGRLSNGRLEVSVGLGRASAAAEALQVARRRVHEELERHELPDLPVNVTLIALQRRTRRELS